MCFYVEILLLMCFYVEILWLILVLIPYGLALFFGLKEQIFVLQHLVKELYKLCNTVNHEIYDDSCHNFDENLLASSHSIVEVIDIRWQIHTVDVMVTTKYFQHLFIFKLLL